MIRRQSYYYLLAILLIFDLLVVGFSPFFRENAYAADEPMVISNSDAPTAENPAIAMNQYGQGVIAWEQEQDMNYNVYAQRINDNGEKLGEPFQVNNYDWFDQRFPKVAMADSGDFVVTWQSYFQGGKHTEVLAQKYNSDGIITRSEFQVNVAKRYNQSAPEIAMMPDGRFVIVWVSELQDDTPKSVYLNFFDANGEAQFRTDLKVNQSLSGLQKNPVVAMNTSGQVMVAWQDINESNKGDENWNINAQLLDWGNPDLKFENDFLVHEVNVLDQIHPHITINAYGEFIVVWRDQYVQPITEKVMETIRGQKISSNGLKSGSSFEISPPSFIHHRFPAVASNGNKFAVAWQNYKYEGWGGLVQFFDQFTAKEGEVNYLDPHRNTYNKFESWYLSPALVFDHKNNIHMAWSEYDYKNQKEVIRYQRLEAPILAPPVNPVKADDIQGKFGSSQ